MDAGPRRFAWQWRDGMNRMRRQGSCRRPRSALVFVAALSMLMIASCGPAPESVLPPSGPQTDGISRPMVIDQVPTTIGVADSDLYGLPLDGVSKALGLMNAVGVGTVRILIPWVAVQRGEDGYDWNLVDRMVDAAVANRLSVLATLNSPPAWAVVPGQQEVAGRPASAAVFGKFAGTVATHFRGKISAYEIWNEPNAAAFFAPTPDPAGFVDLLKAAYPAVKAADPAAIVVTGGLAPIIDYSTIAMDAVEFVRAMYAAGAQRFFDALGYHPYQYTMKFSEGGYHPNSPINQLAAIRQVMLANGDGAKKIWATEYGEPSSVVGEAEQAAYLSDMLRKWQTLPYAGPVYVYTMRDRNSQSVNPDDTLGIYRSDGTAKPASNVVEVSIKQGSAVAPQLNSGRR
jgi:polysaccharide biosynthesis protein PslG